MKKARYRYYVIIQGFKKGITDNWTLCQRYVSGYSGSCYKGFKRLEEAVEYMKRNLLEYDDPYVYEADGEWQEFWYGKELLDFAEDKLREKWQENQKKSK